MEITKEDNLTVSRQFLFGTKCRSAEVWRYVLRASKDEYFRTLFGISLTVLRLKINPTPPQRGPFHGALELSKHLSKTFANFAASTSTQ